tara:strand:- start:7251 stop:7724 length:474 start_codon:yes stop_codon:yes gene_type:complete
MKTIIGIDPANERSAFCVFDEKVIEFGLIDNGAFFGHVLDAFIRHDVGMVYIEDIQSMGMAVGQSVFNTCKYIGRLQLLCEQSNVPYEMVKRTEIKLHHCGTNRAKDSNIRAALIERFGGKGTKANKGFFYGLAGSDIWSAAAISIYGSDKVNGYAT